MKKVMIEWLDHQNRWRHYSSSHHEPTAYKTAQTRAVSTGKRHRITSEEGSLIDVFEP